MNNSKDPIQKGFGDLATEPVASSHFPRAMANLQIQLGRKTQMQKIYRNSALVGTFVLASVIAMTLIPATYSIRVGSMVKAEFSLPEGISPRDVADVAAPFSDSKKMLMVNDGIATITFASKSTRERDAQNNLREAIRAKFPSIKDLNISSEPIIERRGGNALAAMTGGLISIGCEGMSDAEIEAAIVLAFEARGMAIQSVDVSTTSPGDGQIERRIEIRAECDSCDDMPEIELQFDDGATVGGEEHRAIMKEIRREH